MEEFFISKKIVAFLCEKNKLFPIISLDFFFLNQAILLKELLVLRLHLILIYYVFIFYSYDPTSFNWHNKNTWSTYTASEQCLFVSVILFVIYKFKGSWNWNISKSWLKIMFIYFQIAKITFSFLINMKILSFFRLKDFYFKQLPNIIYLSLYLQISRSSTGNVFLLWMHSIY